MNQKELSKPISVGLILTDNQKLLVCHSTGNNFYDLPKGSQEIHETFLDTCIREVQEETGFNLNINKDELVSLGLFSYTRYKNLYLFLLKKTQLPPLSKFKCTSFFVNNVGKKKPEIDGFKYINIQDVEKFMTPSMANVINQAFAKKANFVKKAGA